MLRNKKQDKDKENDRNGAGCTLDEGGLSDEATFEQRPEHGELAIYTSG